MKRTLIVGGGWAGASIAPLLYDSNEHIIVGFLDDNPNLATLKIKAAKTEFQISNLGHSKDLVRTAKKYHVDSVIIAVTGDREKHLLEQIVSCHEHGIEMHEMIDLYVSMTHKIPLKFVNHHWLVPNITVPPTKLYNFFHGATNNLFGLVGFVIGFLPLLPVIAIAIKLDSPGPIFFRQKRIGRNGHAFTLLKFRTMVKDSEKLGAEWTTKPDKRITTVGSLLRKHRLDELPQFINILKGEMSLIGPRPETTDLVAIFKQEVPFYEYRYLVSPGITGWAQVNYENTCSVDGALEKLQYDLYWIKNRSFFLDMKIIFKSLKVMLSGFGAI